MFMWPACGLPLLVLAADPGPVEFEPHAAETSIIVTALAARASIRSGFVRFVMVPFT